MAFADPKTFVEAFLGSPRVLRAVQTHHSFKSTRGLKRLSAHFSNLNSPEFIAKNSTTFHVNV